MICPGDQSGMLPVKISSHYGQTIVVDQCAKCGGIWFDESELYMVKQGEAEKIDSINLESLQHPSNIGNTKIVCPKDGTELQRFTDRYFPRDLILLRCPSCRGIWLNRGMFTKYQAFRAEKLKRTGRSPEDEKLKADIRQLVDSYETDRSNETLTKLSRFLSTEVDNRPVVMAEPVSSPPVAENVLGILNVIFTILRAFVFRF